MLSALDKRQHDPNDVLEISPDVVLVARQAADFPTLAPDTMGREPYPGADEDAAPTRDTPRLDTPRRDTPRLDTTFRAADTSGQRPSGSRWMRRAATVFAFALASVIATAAWERYGDNVRAMLAGQAPEVSLASWLPTSLFSGRAAVAAPPGDAAAPQPLAAADQPAPPAPADNAAASTQDTAQLLQSMARDVANLNQQLGELKASIAQIKASQEQLSREAAKPAEARVSDAKPAVVEPRPARLGAPPRPLGTLVTPPVHRPKPPAYPPAQAAYVPPPPAPAAPVQIAPQATTEPDGSTVVRPPMPLR